MIDLKEFQIKEENIDLEDLILPPDMQENADVLGDLKEEISEVDENIKEKTIQISETKTKNSENFKMNSEMAGKDNLKSMKVKTSASEKKETKQKVALKITFTKQCGEIIPSKQYGCFDCNKKFSSFDKMRVHAAWVHAKPVHLRKKYLSNEANIDLEE